MEAEAGSTAKAKLVRNEQLKVRATFLNTAGSGLLTVGVAGPLAAYLYGVGGAPAPSLGLAGVASTFLGSGFLLHYAAQRTLKGLEP